MASKSFFIGIVFIITWACLFETTSGAVAGWCYQCDSRDPGCQTTLGPFVLSNHRIPCNGQCYIRLKDNILSRGCSWEHGFMTDQVALTPIYDQDTLWAFCDTALCNENANMMG